MPDCTISESVSRGMEVYKPIDIEAPRGWKEVEDSASGRLFIDPGSAAALMPVGGNIQVWTKIEFKRSRISARSGKLYALSLESIVYQCDRQTYFLGMGWNYDAEGNAIDPTPPTPPPLVSNLRPTRPPNDWRRAFDELCKQAYPQQTKGNRAQSTLPDGGSRTRPTH
jgi:hypothetical protein